MPVTAVDLVNQAIQLIGDNQTPVQGAAPNFDSSAAGKAAKVLYAPCVATVMREFGWDAARNTAALILSGGVAPVPYAVEYLYPAFGIQVWALIPPGGDPINDPRPINFNVANALVDVLGVQTQKKVIHAYEADLLAVFNNNPTEDTWDPLLREAVVRLLASEMSIALAGKSGMSEINLKAGGAFEQIGEMRQD
jgi:hypothetical protein